MNNVHNFINAERRKRGLHPLWWSCVCQYNAQESVRVCAERNLLFHSMRSGQFGENLAQGGSRFPSRAVVDCWMHSKKGHRENLLSSRATMAGVGVLKRNGKTFVSWVFSEQSPSFPDCSGYKSGRAGSKSRRRGVGSVSDILLSFLKKLGF